MQTYVRTIHLQASIFNRTIEVVNAFVKKAHYFNQGKILPNRTRTNHGAQNSVLSKWMTDWTDRTDQHSNWVEVLATSLHLKARLKHRLVSKAFYSVQFNWVTELETTVTSVGSSILVCDMDLVDKQWYLIFEDREASSL